MRSLISRSLAIPSSACSPWASDPPPLSAVANFRYYTGRTRFTSPGSRPRRAHQTTRRMNPDANVATSRFTPDPERSSAPHPPAARRQPVEHVIHGDRRVDDYAWLRDKPNPDVIAHLNAGNTYTDPILPATAPF